MATLEKRQRRPPPFPITVVESLNPAQERRHDDLIRREAQVDNLSRDLAIERHERTQADERLHSAQQGLNAIAAVHGAVAKHAATFDKMRVAFREMLARIAAVEAKMATTPKEERP
jgi:hypothetical protein